MKIGKYNVQIDYMPYIHRRSDGRYVVATWDERNSQYIQPMDTYERRITGCSAYCSSSLWSFDGSHSRAQARREAMRRYGRDYLLERTLEQALTR